MKVRGTGQAVDAATSVGSPEVDDRALARLAGGEDAAILPGYRRRARWPLFGALALALAAAVLLALAWGSVRIPVGTIARMVALRTPLVGPRLGIVADWPASSEAIIFKIRLPRVLLAGLVGAALALAGATYQGLFRNPLADPYLIGVASGAALGATVAIALRLPGGLYALGATQWAAFAGAAVAVALVYGLARVGGATPLSTLLLAGVAVGTLATACTSLLLYWQREQLLAVYSWLLGSLTLASWPRVGALALYLALGSLALLPLARLLNALQLGEEEAHLLGIDVEKLKLTLVVAATLVTAAAVSVSGLIGFAGLIMPHIARLLWGPDHRTLLPLSALSGALFLIAVDGVARTVLAPGEVPVGVITALCGAPFFLYLMRRSKRLAF
jgi:iron complex transport system permease protein